MRRVAVALVALIAAGAVRTAAHEIPADVTVHVFVRPEDSRLRVLVRAPLAAMRDVNFPTRGPAGYLILESVDPFLRSAASLWIADAFRMQEGRTLLRTPDIAAIRVSLPSDESFVDYTSAVRHVTGGPLPADTELVWTQALLDVLFEYPIQSDRSDFAIDPAFARLGQRVTTVLRFVPAGGPVRAFELSGDPGLVRLDPRWQQAALTFVRAGFFHILDGIDHLLFLFCLVIPLRKLSSLILVVTAFTVAHSMTLIGSTFGLAPSALWFPPLVETLIAMSIVYMALENIFRAAGGRSESGRSARVAVAFLFGLVHGFGFSFALRESLQFAGSHLLTSLLSFNVGVEAGQILVLMLLVPLLNASFRAGLPERTGVIVLSAIVAHTGWHWMLDRGARLGQYSFVWPAVDAAFAAAVMRWAMVVVVLCGLIWLVRILARERVGVGLTSAREKER